MADAPWKIAPGDALLVVDVQYDFLPGGSLGVPEGDRVVPVLNDYIGRFVGAGRPVYATQDWHPTDHCSFAPQGGPWPPHCIQGTRGAELADDLRLPKGTPVVRKGTQVDRDAYSGFDGTDLGPRLRADGVRRLSVGGLATDYCVLSTVKDARAAGFEVRLLTDAIRAVNVNPDDGDRALAEMTAAGAVPAILKDLAP